MADKAKTASSRAVEWMHTVRERVITSAVQKEKGDQRFFIKLIIVVEGEDVMKAPRIFLLAIVLMAVAILLTSPILSAQPRKPNIIFILTDDLDTEYPNNSWIDHFPRLKSLLTDQGTTFKILLLACRSVAHRGRPCYAANTPTILRSSRTALPGAVSKRRMMRDWKTRPLRHGCMMPATGQS